VPPSVFAFAYTRTDGTPPSRTQTSVAFFDVQLSETVPAGTGPVLGAGGQFAEYVTFRICAAPPDDDPPDDEDDEDDEDDVLALVVVGVVVGALDAVRVGVGAAEVVGGVDDEALELLRAGEVGPGVPVPPSDEVHAASAATHPAAARAMAASATRFIAA
jgi:hypothetical protein